MACRTRPGTHALQRLAPQRVPGQSLRLRQTLSSDVGQTQGEKGPSCCARLLLERVPLARRRIVALGAARVRGSRGGLRGRRSRVRRRRLLPGSAQLGRRGRLRRRQLPPGGLQLGRGGVGRREPGAQPRRRLPRGGGVRGRLRRPGPCFPRRSGWHCPVKQPVHIWWRESPALLPRRRGRPGAPCRPRRRARPARRAARRPPRPQRGAA